MKKTLASLTLIILLSTQINAAPRTSSCKGSWLKCVLSKFVNVKFTGIKPLK